MKNKTKQKKKKENEKKTKQSMPGGDRTADIEPTQQDMASIFTW
jgi:hypothetical protein